VEIPPEEQARMRAELRRARYGHLLKRVCKLHAISNEGIS
jgi:hypothetical protein